MGVATVVIALVIIIIIIDVIVYAVIGCNGSCRFYSLGHPGSSKFRFN